ncbi:MAG: DNA polymerase III subunit gamma/tau [Cyclobacteriaceae bacterium]
MENFVVSARKYRPLGFEEVVGQEHITTTLENAIKSNHLGQALLFCGPRGVGKTTCARILAKTINGFENEGPEGTSNFNIFELDAASNNSVEDIRNLIDQVRYPPQQGKYKVYIIDEVHMLSNQAFNAFLKTLEEPPDYAIFILATTEKHKVIPTILSRCQIYDFNRIEVDDIVKQLQKIAEKEGVEAEHDALHLIGQKADGALRDALSIFDLITTFSSDGKVTYADTIKNLHILDYDYYFRLVDHLLAENMSEAILLFDEIIRNGFDGNNFLIGLQQHLRNLLISKDSKTVALLEVSETLKGKYLEQSLKCDQSFLLSSLNICNQFELNYKISKNQRLHVELCLMKLAHLPSALTLTANSTEDGVKKKQHSSVKKAGEPKKETPKAEASPIQKPAVPEQAPVPEQPSTATSPSPDTPPPPEEPPLPEEPPRQEDFIPTIEAEIPVASTPKSEPRPVMIKEPPPSSEVKETPSIFKKKKQEVKEEPSENSVSNKKEEEFTEENLQKAWKQFGEEKSDAGDTDKLILGREIKKGENSDVLMFLSSQLEVSFLEKFETELIQFLRTELNNDHLSINKQVAQVDEGKKLYTSKDIYDHMVKQNPKLADLKERLGLDFDY